MTDIDLDKLKHIAAPAPRAEAKARALAAAQQAFAQPAAAGPSDIAPANDNANDNVVSSTIVTAQEVSTQGSAAAVRPIDVIHKPRSVWMRRETYALAASVAVLAIGLPVAINHMKQPRQMELASNPITITREGKMPVVRAPDEPTRKGAVIPVGPDGRIGGEVAAPKVAAAPAATSPSATAMPGMVLEAPAATRSNELAAKAEAARRTSDQKSSADAKARAEAKAKAAADKDAAGTNRMSALLDKAAPNQLGAPSQQVATLPPPASTPAQQSYLHQRAPLNAEIAERQRQAYEEYKRQQQLANPDHQPPTHLAPSRDRFAAADPYPVKSVAAEPVSTFSVDVDTAAYAFARRSLNGGRLPPRESVRVEEMLNYFPYGYPRPDSNEVPFRPTVTVLPSPWNAANKLVHIAIKGYDLKSQERPRANLVFLVDVSGSMQPADRLPLLKNAFRMLLDNLQPDDSVAIVTYANGSDVRLPPTKVADKYKIAQAIESLNAGGSTHGAAGISDAYKVAEMSFDKSAVNRVILATDGDWNVGITDKGELQKFIERKRDTGIYLSILGVGMGNHNDALMQALAQNGNGIAAYIDTLSEARKVLVDEASSTLFPIAKDVKIQIEFNPARVSEYRLIGYETRALKREDFNNDKVDAGDIGSGHTVTAIYEITPVGAPGVADGLRYGKEAAKPAAAPAPASGADSEYAFLKIRYKLPKEETSRLITLPVNEALEARTVAAASTEVRFSVAVAAFGQLLRGVPHLKSFGFDDVIALANGARGDDPFGYRAEMVNLARLAKSAQP